MRNSYAEACSFEWTLHLWCCCREVQSRFNWLDDKLVKDAKGHRPQHQVPAVIASIDTPLEYQRPQMLFLLFRCMIQEQSRCRQKRSKSFQVDVSNAFRVFWHKCTCAQNDKVQMHACMQNSCSIPGIQ